MRNCLPPERPSRSPKRQPSRHGGIWTSISNGSGSTRNFTQKRWKDVNVVSSGKPSWVPCKQAAWLPIQLVATASTGLLHATLAYPRRRWLRAKLKDRLQELDHPSEPQFTRQLQERIQAMDRRGLR